MPTESRQEKKKGSAPHEKQQYAVASQIDVARLAHVSQAAVSRTFTPGASVSDDTRAKVLSAAEELGYRPNVIARSLIRKSTNIIGLVVMRFTNPFYARMIRDFTHAFQKQGYWTLLFNIAHTEEVEDALPAALQYQVDGLIITSATLSSRMAEECARSGTPVVLFNRYSVSDNVNMVCCDNIRGGRLVADAMLDAGHQRIAFIAGEESASTNRDREQGFVDRLRERGSELAIRESAGSYTYEAGYEAARRLLQRDNPPDGVFCASDLVAMGAMDLARGELHCRIPEDLSIVGFDDIPMAGWPGYSLTTVHQPIDEMVRSSVKVLMDAIISPGGDNVIKVIVPTLVVRASTRSVNA